MIDITFEVNGRRVRPESIGNALEKALIQDIAELIKKKLRRGLSPSECRQIKIKGVGRSLDNLSIQLEGEETVIERAQKLFN